MTKCALCVHAQVMCMLRVFTSLHFVVHAVVGLMIGLIARVVVIVFVVPFP